MIVIGLDIGLTGALAGVDSRGSAQVRDLSTAPDGEGRRLDGRALLLALREFVPAGEAALVIIEDVRPRPMGNGGAHGNTMHSQGSLMRSRGIVEAVTDIARLQVKAVQPQAWKRHFGLIGKEKGDALVVARSLFPAIAHDLRLAKWHNRADALLLAQFGQARFA